jgi:hypothetical protein
VHAGIRSVVFLTWGSWGPGAAASRAECDPGISPAPVAVSTRRAADSGAVLAFGYMRYSPHALDVQVVADEKAIKIYAARLWWVLENIYVEEQADVFAQFDKMLADAAEWRVRHLIVPSALHLSPHRLLRAMLVEHAADKDLIIWSASVATRTKTICNPT